MKSSSYRVILVSLLMIFSSLAGCLGGDEETLPADEGAVGTVMVSTYHVGELVKAVAGDRVTLDYMSQDNIPVHDYEPSAADILRLQGSDVFFYHGLGLEPWVDSTIESMGDAAPTAIGTHAMPGDESTLDYEGMLVTELCELLSDGPYESTTLAMDEDEASEIHAEYVAHTLSFPEMEDEHGDEEHDEHGDEEHDEHGDEEHDEHGEEHDEHDHADHGHASPEETIENPAGCPADSVISIFHMEEGEYILEFEEAEASHEFNMAILKMGGGHAHHDHHGHGDDHDEHGDEDGHDEHGDEDGHDEHGDEDGHDEHGDEDGHDEHGEDHDEDMTPEHAIEMYDENNDDHISWDEFVGMMETMDDDHDDHGEHMSHSVTVLFPDNTIMEFETDHDMLPENATGWNLTSVTMNMNNISLNYSVHEQLGTSLTGINGTDLVWDDCECYWNLQIWNETSEAWESSSVGIDSLMIMHDTDHIAWAASNADMSLLDSPEHHDDHDPIEEAMEEYMMDVLMSMFNESDADNDALLSVDELENFIESIEHIEDELEPLLTEIMISAFDDDEDGNLSMSEFVSMMESMDDGHDDHGDDHDDGEHSDEEEGHDETEMMEMMFGMFDGNEDGFIDASELDMLMEMMGDDEHAGHVKIHIEAEGEYGFALPHDVEFYVLMGEGGHDDHDDHAGHDDHDDHGDDDHDEDHDEEEMVCYDMSSHTVDASYTTESDCEAAGLMWTAANSGPSDDDHDDHEGEEALNYDPHSWLDPVAFKVQMNIVMEGLIAAFPSAEDDFRANAEAFGAELDAMDDAYEAAFGENGTCAAGGHEKTVAANHNAYSYIAVRYDIQFVTVHGLDPEGEPSPEDIAKVVEHINEEGLTVLYVEEYTDASSVGSIVQDTGVTIQYLYTMEMAPIDSNDDYMSLMNKNLDNLVSGIGC